MEGVQRLEKSFTICIIPNGPAILDMDGIHRTDRPRRRRYVVQMCHNRLLMRNRHIESADPQGDRTSHGRGKPCSRSLDQESASSGMCKRNSFGPSPALDSPLLTPDILALARGIYEERQLPEGTLDPARLAALADALKDAGCTNADILNHLRGPSPHVRGCYVLDLLLGRQ